ncbi:sterol carrier family protein [Spelaeicoccus albus]|uniref:Bacterial SCP orthologue domain-containing protein n=1 Tax=Spelaeicoccus albus TaxID=1280376 RepID=A0A7Z0CZA3_9MICO|nr:sterol carrier family protein [Spelaeicoccus albus]NYI66131.1 hypothetical protein [Spelaeicoccus albus]
MTARRRIDETEGRHAVRAWKSGARDRTTVALAVRFCLEEITARAPGNSVELRVPPHGVTQCVAGPRHTRGTPPNVIEMDADTWLGLATGTVNWDEAAADRKLSASGVRADVSEWLPLDI